MRSVVFGSYKGGVGRTYAAVSAANTLVRYGKDVLLIDFDLDAPSIPTAYGLPVWEAKGAPRTGVVPWLMGESGSLAANLIEERRSGPGRLRLLPAGPVGPKYLDDLLDDRWRSVVERDAQNFSQYLSAEIMALADPPDFVIVDSRSGLAPTSGSLLTEFADTVAFLMAGDPESIEVANSLTRTLGADRVVPVLSRFPMFIDPELTTIQENLDALNDKDGLSFLHAAPGHEGSIVPTIGLEQVNRESPLTLDHFRLIQKLEPSLQAAPPGHDPELADVWLRAQRTIPIDYKLFRVVARGHMVNLSDASRNVAFKVDTIASILATVAASLEPDEVASALTNAGHVAGTAFGSALAKDLDLQDETDPHRRLAMWCEFDSSTGFGNMEAVETKDGVEIYLRDAFLNPNRGGQQLLEGYVIGVIEKLLTPVPAYSAPQWMENEPTLLVRIVSPNG